MPSVPLAGAIAALSGVAELDLRRDEPLARHTSYRIGGPCALFVTAHTYAALWRCLEVLRAEGVGWVVLGKGTNVLVADEGFEGCVVTLGRDFSRIDVDPKAGIVRAGAAIPLSQVVTGAMRAGLTGLEFASGVPGSFGGALSMDAGTRLEWIGTRVREVITLKPGEGMRRYRGSSISWGYRSTTLPGDEIVLEGTLALAHGDRAAIAQDMEGRIARRRATQPLSEPSCGSVFRNPPERSVGRLLEDCGLKGFSIGGARVSERHANFVVSDGTATADDVLAVMTTMHDKVSETYGIDLRPEVKFLGFPE